MAEKLLHPIPEACQMLGLGRATLYTEMSKGRLGYVKVGARRLIPHEAVVAYVSMLSDEGADTPAAS